MRYDIIEKAADLAASGEPPDEKLRGILAHLVGAFPFDCGSIYLWDGVKRVFTLYAAVGPEAGLGARRADNGAPGAGAHPEVYGEAEGLPGLAKALGEPVTAAKGGASQDKGDKGLKGFSGAIVLPLKDAAGFHGVMYLKSRKECRLSASTRQTLKVASIFALFAVRCAELAAAHDRIQAEVKEAQARLASTEKIMALGDMAATLAHEIRSPLISIGAVAGKLKRLLSAGHSAQGHIDRIAKEAARLEGIMDGVVRFLKDYAVEFHDDDMTGVVDASLAVFEDELKERGINLRKRYHAGPLPIRAEREQLKVAFDNLIANAIQSMPRGGTITVATGMAGDMAFADVADNGGGIDPRHLASIFNPFFTTKEHGTGLGLPISNSIIMRHKGVIEVNNRVGAGVTFTVKLPSAQGAARAKKASE